MPAQSWQVLSAGAGAKRPRLYAWAWITITGPDDYQWLLIRTPDTLSGGWDPRFDSSGRLRALFPLSIAADQEQER